MADETRRDEPSRQPAHADERERARGTAADEAADVSDRAPTDRGERDDAAEVEQDLDALLADVKRERDEYLELAQRARADFENFRKRAAREAQEAERRGKASVARELLPALDSLERALSSTGIDPASGRPIGGTEPTPSEEDAAAFDVPSEEVSAQEALARGVALVSSAPGSRRMTRRASGSIPPHRRHSRHAPQPTASSPVMWSKRSSAATAWMDRSCEPREWS